MISFLKQSSAFSLPLVLILLQFVLAVSLTLLGQLEMQRKITRRESSCIRKEITKVQAIQACLRNSSQEYGKNKIWPDGGSMTIRNQNYLLTLIDRVYPYDQTEKDFEASPPTIAIRGLPINSLTGTLKKPWTTNLNESNAYDPPEQPLVINAGDDDIYKPILIEAGFSFGIYSSGSIDHILKEVHLRFQIHGTLWNPYNVPIVLNDSSQATTRMWIKAKSLPGIEISNLATGEKLTIKQIDTLKNYISRDQGIFAWFDLPNRIEPGQKITFTTPDPIQQPQGLERLITRQFSLGLSDSLTLKYTDPNSPIVWEFTDENDPHFIKPWRRFEASFVPPKTFVYSRADDPKNPFWIGPISSRFRFSNWDLKSYWILDTLKYIHEGIDLRLPHKETERLVATPTILQENNLPILDHHPNQVYEIPKKEATTLAELRCLIKSPSFALLGHPDAHSMNTAIDSFTFDQEKINAIHALAEIEQKILPQIWIKNPIYLNTSNPNYWMKIVEINFQSIGSSFIFNKFSSTDPFNPSDWIEVSSAKLYPFFEAWTLNTIHTPNKSISEAIASSRNLSIQSQDQTKLTSLVRYQPKEFNLADLLIPLANSTQTKSDSIELIFQENSSSYSSNTKTEHFWFQRIPLERDQPKYAWLVVQRFNTESKKK